MRAVNNITRGVCRLGINAGRPSGLPGVLRRKFLFLWTGGYTGNNLKDSLGSGAVITVTNKDWSTSYIPYGSYYVKYGLLYNWYAATDARNIANTGWHVPDNTNDFDPLIAYLGGTSVAGGKLKETGWSLWNYPNTGATNAVGFNSRPSGSRQHTTGMFLNIRLFANYLSKELYTADAYHALSTMYMLPELSGYTNVTHHKGVGNSIRLVKDSTTLTNGQTGTYVGNDGKVYRTICIGTQEWLADNLAETKYRNGDAIPEVTNNAEWAALATGALCAYNNDWNNVEHIDATFSVPNNATFLAADGTDDFWFDGSNVLQQKIRADLIASTTLRTFIKYSDFEPYNIYGIGILKTGETLTEADKIKLNRYFKLWAEYWGELMDSGYMKDNRVGGGV